VHGHRVLSSGGKKYKTETKAALVERFPRELRFFKDNTPYLVCIRFYFSEVENKGWFQGKAASRYKHLDLTNRVKLLEDCLKDAAGIDDSQHLRVVLDKQKGTERTVIWVWDLEQEETPFDVGFNSL
jgi:Holliday junction resolvase RusA-like endonuclease